MKKIIAILLFFLLSYVSAYAVGVPSIFSYQGRLADSGGNLLGTSSGTTYYFKFSIWDDPTSNPSTGNRLWPSAAPSSVSATVRQGVFNVDINTSSYNFNTDEDIYLQVEASSDNVTFETLSPRQRISAAPFAQISGAVSGIGQSSFGTTTPISNSVVTIEATSTGSTGLSIRGILGQLANLFQIQDSAGVNLFVVDSSGKVGVGTSTATRKFNVLGAESNPQLRLSQASDVYGEFKVDNLGDVWLSSTGKDITQADGNLWVCSGETCDPAIVPVGQGNMIVETALIFDNKFKFKLETNVGATNTIIMLDSLGNEILEFDEDGGP